MGFFGVLFLLLFIASVLCFVWVCRSDSDLSLSLCDKLWSGKLSERGDVESLLLPRLLIVPPPPQQET